MDKKELRYLLDVDLVSRNRNIPRWAEDVRQFGRNHQIDMSSLRMSFQRIDAYRNNIAYVEQPCCVVKAFLQDLYDDAKVDKR